VGKAPLPAEFDLIARYFAPLAAGAPGALGLLDDAALVDVTSGHRLVVTVDALVAGVHFLPDDPADLIARKALRVNLSDLAAMGARPIGYFLASAFAEQDEQWLATFTRGLAQDQAEFGVSLMGGDTVSTPGPLTLSITAIGEVGIGRELRRNAARIGDLVCVSGTLGDSALGLLALREELPQLSTADRQFLIGRYRLPEPQVALGQALSERRLTRCAMDVSDGLAADLGHICRASGVGARLEWQRLPLSDAAAAALAIHAELRERVVSGGDDYELLFTIAAAQEPAVLALGERLGVRITRIGVIEPGSDVVIVDESGAPMRLRHAGFRHF
jgi:thiamine-monophosphate kinase